MSSFVSSGCEDWEMHKNSENCSCTKPKAILISTCLTWMTSPIPTHPLFAHCGKFLTRMSWKLELSLWLVTGSSVPDAPISIPSNFGSFTEKSLLLEKPFWCDDDANCPISHLWAQSSSSCSFQFSSSENLLYKHSHRQPKMSEKLH